MATVTKTYTENQNGSSYRSTWTLVFTINNITVTGNSFVLSEPSATAKYVYSGKTRGWASWQLYVNDTHRFTQGRGASGPVSWASGVTNTVPSNPTVGPYDPSSYTLTTSTYFNSSNPTTRTLQWPIVIKSYSVMLWSSNNSESMLNYYYPSSDISLGNVSITLNAPPTFTSSQVSFDTSYDVYAGLTTASVDISSLSAKYGGYISKAELKIGSQTASLTGTATNVLSGGTLSIPLNAAGTFTPTVTVTDSRGQTTTISLNEITVQQYQVNVSSLQARRIDPSTCRIDDEGTNAVLVATFMHSHFSGSSLSSPTVTVDGSSANATWYTGWTSENGFTGAVSNWGSLAAEVTLYAKITTTMSRDASHTIEVTPRTTLRTGNLMSTLLPQSFYLLVGRPGGHGLGVGMKPPSDALHIDMDAFFYKNIFAASMAGMIEMFAGSTAPQGWLLCNGAAISRNTYAKLFSVIGTTFGAGDGSTTFNLPDFRNNFPVGAGSTYALNSKGGANSVTLTTNTIPAHTHGKSGAISSGITSSGAHTHTFKTQADYASSGTKKGIYSTDDGTWSGTSIMTSSGAHTHNLPAHEHTSVGGGQAHENRPPYIGINFIICTGTA